MAYHRAHGVETRIVRIFNTYGPRMRAEDGRVVPTFISQALRGEDLTVFGDGSQTRSFCYVDDLVDGILRLLDGTSPEPCNIGNPVEAWRRARPGEWVVWADKTDRVDPGLLPGKPVDSGSRGKWAWAAWEKEE